MASNFQCDHPIEFGSHESNTPISIDLITQTRLMIWGDELFRRTKLRNLETQKKLCLVLDLDHTLIHSKTVHTLEKYLKVSNCEDILRWDMMGIEYVTKLRPFVRKFLEEASSLFEMYIYTMGTRTYALNIAKILDPESRYFGSRIISREDCTKKGQKGLDIVHVHESGVIIVDDTESVWTRHKRNLIVMDRYCYFDTNTESSGRSLLEEGIDEIEDIGALSHILEVLKEVHSLYFEWQSLFDVRELLEVLRKEVLEGCKLVICKEDATTPSLQVLAEQMGAVCLEEYSSALATHVVCSDAHTSEAQLALSDNKFLVCPEWICESYFLWRKQPEEEFPASSSSDTGFENCKRRRDDDEYSSGPLQKRQKEQKILLM